MTTLRLLRVFVPDFAGALGLLTFLAMWGGFVLSVLWSWFLVPLGLPAITWLQASGLLLIGQLLSGNYGINEPDCDGNDGCNYIAGVVQYFSYPLIFLCIGFSAQAFM